MKVAVLVPRRADGGRRDEVWAWVKARWERVTDYEVHEGHHDEGPFNRSFAINRAAESAGAFDVAIVADADSFCGNQQLAESIDQATATGRITFAFEHFYYLNRQGSDLVTSGYEGMWEPYVDFRLSGTCSSMVVVTRALWDAVGGFDEGFVGWGMEDVGFSLASQALGGGMNRVQGPCWHLWHNPSPENAPTPAFLANVARMKQYEACDYDPDKMRALLDSLRA